MINLTQLKVGDKVHYRPEYYGNNRWENGRVKEIRNDNDSGVWVVYNCAGNWDLYKDYTSELTFLHVLYLGWKHEANQEKNNDR